MNKDLIDSIFNFSGNGYIVLPRKLVELIINQITNHTPASLYAHMLVHANYSPTHNPKGILINRGDIFITPSEITKLTGWSRSKMYENIKLLEINNLVVRCYNRDRNLFSLPQYEDHCGHKVRPQEKKHTPTEEENQTEKSFQDFFGYYYFLLGTKPSEKEKARREWHKLSLDERNEAAKNLKLYKDTIRKQEHIKQACNYLKDKSFKF